MAHSFHHPDASFNYSQYHRQAPLQPPAQEPLPAIAQKVPRKAKKCRKRHPPPGPAGVWFLARSNGSKTSSRVPYNRGANPASESGRGHASSSSTPDEENDDQRQTTSNMRTSTVSNPAWTAAMCSLNLILPDVSSSHLSMLPALRYKQLRPHVPPEFLLLPELQKSTSWRFKPGQKLVVLVRSVACHHDDIWTVELQDDTGSTIDAWMQPAFVQSEKQNLADSGPKYIRPGYVWCLENCTLMLQQLMGVTNDNDDNNNTSMVDGDEVGTQAQANPYQRMLLVTEKNVAQVWTPESIRKIPGDEFTQWTGRRCTFLQEWEERHGNSISNLTPSRDSNLGQSTRATNRNMRVGNQSEDEEEEEEDEEDRYRWQLNSMRRSSPPKPVDEAENIGAVGGPKILSLHAHSMNAAATRRIQPSTQETYATTAPRHNSQAAIAQKTPPNQPRLSQNEEDDRARALSVNTRHNPLETPDHGHNICDNDNIHTAQHSSAPHNHRQTTPTREERQLQPKEQPQPANPYKDTLGSHRKSDFSHFASGKEMDRSEPITNNGPRRVSLTQAPAALAPASTQTQIQATQQGSKNWQSGEENRRGNPPSQQHGASQASASFLANNNSSLSQFSAFAITAQAQAPQQQQQQQPMDESAGKEVSRPERSDLSRQETTPPAKRSKSEEKQRKKKKQNYSVSPLSQSPKDSTPFLLGGATLLGLSSDEDEGEDQSKACVDPIKLQNPKLHFGTSTCNEDEKTTKAAESRTGLAQTSFLASESGVHFMGLSDEDD